MSVSNVSSATAGSSASGEARNQLGKNDFLKLLLTQLQNQDPLSPVDNQQMLAQLAQFSSLEQMQGVSDRLDTLLLAQSSTNQLATTSLVGRNVTYRTDGVDWAPGGGPAQLTGGLSTAARVTAVIQDETGRTVRTVDLGAREAGPIDIAWDGRDGNGNTLPAGHYTVSLAATSGTGEKVAVELRARGLVRGVTFDGDAPLLLIGGSRVRMSDVVEVIQT